MKDTQRPWQKVERAIALGDQKWRPILDEIRSESESALRKDRVFGLIAVAAIAAVCSLLILFPDEVPKILVAGLIGVALCAIFAAAGATRTAVIRRANKRG